MTGPSPSPVDGDRTDRLARRLATLFGLGDRLPAPGTLAGSLPAALVWLGLAALGPPALVSALTAVLSAAAAAAGTWAGGLEAHRRGRRDPGAVVIDEVAGQWVTLAVAAPWMGSLPGGPAAVAAAGFVAFRLLDVAKPWPVSWFEGLPGGLGIMADDLAAGALAGAALACLGAQL